MRFGGCHYPGTPLARVLAVLLLLLALAPAWGAPVLQVAPQAREVSLARSMWVERVPLASAADPVSLWARPQPRGMLPADMVSPDGDNALVARITLAGGVDDEISVLHVPSTRMDEVQVWWRVNQGVWRSALAGDQVPLARWPVYGPQPTFALHRHAQQPLDLIVVLRNAGALPAPIMLQSHQASSEFGVRQANLSGVVVGMGVMVVIVCLISALTLQSAAGWVNLAYALWAILAVLSVNGYGAIWVLPDVPALNDGAKVFSLMVLAALMPWAVAAQCGPVRSVVRNVAGFAGCFVAGTVGIAVILAGAGDWRVPVIVGASAIGILVAAWLGLLEWLRGGRQAVWVGVGIAAYATTIALGALGAPLSGALDWQSALAGALLFASVLALRHTQFLRLRYGRDVLGREAAAHKRDPLTALWSYQGFQDRFDEALLRDAASGEGRSAMLLMRLVGLEQATDLHGFEATESALVSLAASLRQVFGDGWAVGRLSKSRFAAISAAAVTDEAMQQMATAVLAHCTRLTGAVNPVTDFDLHIVARAGRAGDTRLVDVLREMDEEADRQDGIKRIAVV